MSMTEQKFDSLCSFAEKLDLGIDIKMYGKRISIEININSNDGFHTGVCESPDQALTEALRYLRKISKQQNK